MIICEERQLPPNNSRQHDDYAVKATEMTEADPLGDRPAIDNRRAVGGDAHSALGAAQTPSKRWSRGFNPGANPLVRQRTKLAANTVNNAWINARRTATHQVLDFEGGCFSSLLPASIVWRPL